MDVDIKSVCVKEVCLIEIYHETLKQVVNFKHLLTVVMVCFARWFKYLLMLSNVYHRLCNTQHQFLDEF